MTEEPKAVVAVLEEYVGCGMRSVLLRQPPQPLGHRGFKSCSPNGHCGLSQTDVHDPDYMTTLPDSTSSDLPVVRILQDIHSSHPQQDRKNRDRRRPLMASSSSVVVAS